MKKCKICENEAVKKRSMCESCRLLKRRADKLYKGLIKRPSALVCTLPGFNMCSKCNCIKAANAFRTRSDKPQLLVSWCKVCESSRNKKNQCLYAKTYREKHSNKLAVLIKGRSQAERDKLSDNYVKAVCRKQLLKKGIKISHSEIHPALLEAKRIVIQSYRLTRETK